ncbi:MAG TPA: hypothetical protein DCE41_08050 [Cytophagales bacterium]|nr:hypothetical protein [Cytophagales bacterium]HAA22396.1 hypothetical protein [Cytophagales bacterium]HAP61862.1 hypothetical protein [Cytophagales bacterium]
MHKSFNTFPVVLSSLLFVVNLGFSQELQTAHFKCITPAGIPVSDVLLKYGYSEYAKTDSEGNVDLKISPENHLNIRKQFIIKTEDGFVLKEGYNVIYNFRDTVFITVEKASAQYYQDEIIDLINDNDQLKQQIAFLDSQNKREIAKQKGVYEQMISDYESQISTLKVIIDQKEEQLRLGIGDSEQLKKEIADLMDRINYFEERIDELVVDKSNLQSKVISLQNQTSKLEGNVDVLLDSLIVMDRDYEALENLNTSLQNNIRKARFTVFSDLIEYKAGRLNFNFYQTGLNPKDEIYLSYFLISSKRGEFTLLEPQRGGTRTIINDQSFSGSINLNEYFTKLLRSERRLRRNFTMFVIYDPNQKRIIYLSRLIYDADGTLVLKKLSRSF